MADAEKVLDITAALIIFRKYHKGAAILVRDGRAFVSYVDPYTLLREDDARVRGLGFRIQPQAKMFFTEV